MSEEQNARLRSLRDRYVGEIRSSDGNSTIAVLFVAIMMGTVIQYQNFYPWYLPLPILLLPFMFIFLNLLVSVYPRYPRVGRARFPVRRRMRPEDFDFLPEADAHPNSLPETCAMFSRLLWWKNTTLRLAYVTAVASLVTSVFLLFFAR